MREVFDFAPSDLLKAVARSTGRLETNEDSPMAARVRGLIEGAGRTFSETAQPRGVWQTIAATDFNAIYDGDGENDADTPLEVVLEDAVALALFAATVGDDVSQRIPQLFDTGDLAEGYLLDQVASFAADELAQIAARRFGLSEKQGPDHAVLPYSPGYCGWHVSGQSALFAALEPAEIGITINDSCLMSPIKSVSGVLVLAPVEAHCISPSFTCCATCTTLDCQERTAGFRKKVG